MGIRVVENNEDYGLYVWMMDNGKPFGDGNGNVMNVPGRSADINAMNAIMQAAKYYGAPSGNPKFMPGTQRVSEMRYSEEIGRMKEGLIPSETDIGAWRDAEAGYDAAIRRGDNYDD